jgi:hypothetical protein
MKRFKRKRRRTGGKVKTRKMKQEVLMSFFAKVKGKAAQREQVLAAAAQR